MEIKKLDRDLIFYIPGKPGAVFTYGAGFAMSNDLLIQTVEDLEYDAGARVQWVAERRSEPRPA